MQLALERFESFNIPHSTVWLLEACAAAQAELAPLKRLPLPRLEPLRRQARVHSVESSNRIEGVTVETGRLGPLVLDGARPRDRSEEEIRGYARTLDWIHAGKAEPPLTPELIRALHLRTFRGQLSSDAGELKASNNDIIEFDSRGVGRVVFRTTDWREAPGLLGRLCQCYAARQQQPGISSLLVTATFISDFLCIHPFRDGNGRTSRLLTTAMLRWQGYQVVELVSLERLIEEDKENYYRALREAQSGWHEGSSSPVPWWNYLLGILRRAHDDARRLVATLQDRPRPEVSAQTIAAPARTMGELVRATALGLFEPFTVADLCSLCRGASDPLVRKTLQRMKAAGEVTLTGRGRGAVWRVVRRP